MVEKGRKPYDVTLPRWPMPQGSSEPAPEGPELDNQQCDAAKAAHKLFVAMANRHLDEKPGPEAELYGFLPQIDEYRRNQTILIDGSRGSGKTVVMLRLLKDWSEQLVRPGKLKSPLYSSKYQEEVAALSEGAVLVPVGLLDLEAVPERANLATRLAGMFERVVASIERRGKAGASSSTWALESDTLKSREKWKRFVHAAALEWDKSQERRRANIDPEAYAVEVEQGEIGGLRARETFGEFVDALVKDWFEWSQQRGARPFFIIPIDDADLNPGRVVELFGMLRTLAHSRVGYLLTGDTYLFAHVLTAFFRSQVDMSELRTSGLLGKAQVQLVPDEGRRIEGLARDYYQKIVPLPHRLRIRPLSAQERLEVVVPSLSRARSDKADGTGRANETIEQYLTVDEFAPLALYGRRRQLNDLRDYLMSGKYDVPLGAEQFALGLWRQALRDSSLDGRYIREFEALAYVDEHRKLLRVVTSGKVEVVFGGAVRIARDFCVNGQGEIAVNSRFAPYAAVRDKNSDLVLDDAMLASWLLMVNIARKHDEPGLRPPNESPFVFDLAEVSIVLPEMVLPELTSAQKALVLRWPVPRWRQQFEKQRFYKIWNDRTLSVSREVNVIGKLARVFVASVLDASQRVSELEHAIVGGEVGEDFQVPSWPELVSRLSSVTAPTGTPLADWALRHAGLLAAPESGLPHDDANDFFDALMRDSAWSPAANANRILLLSARRARVEDAISRLWGLGSKYNIKSVTEAVLRQIDSMTSEYRWVEYWREGSERPGPESPKS